MNKSTNRQISTIIWTEMTHCPSILSIKNLINDARLKGGGGLWLKCMSSSQDSDDKCKIITYFLSILVTEKLYSMNCEYLRFYRKLDAEKITR